MLFLPMIFLLFLLILYNLKPNPTHSLQRPSCHQCRCFLNCYVLLLGALQCILAGFTHQNALFSLLKHYTSKEEQRKDKDMPLQIASIFLFDNFNNVYITVLENQFNMAFSCVFFSQLHVSETYTLISSLFSLFSPSSSLNETKLLI